MATEDAVTGGELARTFVELADTLVEGYDPIEFLLRLAERCVSALGVSEAGVVLADSGGQLRALASSSERMRHLELIEVQRQDGPCLDSWRTGEVVREDHLSEAQARWPHFTLPALDAGFASVYAVPMRLRDDRLGALNLFSTRTSGLAQSDETLAQAMADVATIGILHKRFIRKSEEVSEQLSGGVQHQDRLGAGQGGGRRVSQDRHGRSLHVAARLCPPSQHPFGRGGAARDRTGLGPWGPGDPTRHPRYPPPVKTRPGRSENIVTERRLAWEPRTRHQTRRKT